MNDNLLSKYNKHTQWSATKVGLGKEGCTLSLSLACKDREELIVEINRNNKPKLNLNRRECNIDPNQTQPEHQN